MVSFQMHTEEEIHADRGCLRALQLVSAEALGEKRCPEDQYCQQKESDPRGRPGIRERMRARGGSAE